MSMRSGELLRYVRPAPRFSVLLLEPHDDSRSLYADYLSHNGIAVTAVDSAVNAVRAMQGKPNFGVIVLSLRLPQIDALALCDVLQAMAARDGARFVGVASSSFDRERAVHDGRFDTVLIKPCLPEVLLAALRKTVTSSAPVRSA